MEGVAGFLIDHQLDRIVLVRKDRPDWQAGKLNGVGGRIETFDGNAQAAMRREFKEEAGVDIEHWNRFAMVHGSWGYVHFFRCFGDSSLVRTMESEKIETPGLHEIPYSECLPNLSWLIPLALYRHDIYVPVVAEEMFR